MLYSLLLIVHLLAAIAFIGTLFFEVVIWHSAREELAWSAPFTSEQAIARRPARLPTLPSLRSASDPRSKAEARRP